MEEMKKEITGYFPGEYRPCIFEIPYKTPEIEFGDSCDRKVLDGMHSGSRYPNKAHGDFVAELAKLFAYSNPLHFDLHPMVKQMEN